MRDDVYTWILRCDIYITTKRPNRTPRAPLGKMQVGAPFDRLSTDYLGLLQLQLTFRYILVATAAFTKWVKIFQVPDLSAKT